MIYLLWGLSLSPIDLQADHCIPRSQTLKDLADHFEVFYPEKGVSYGANFYLATDPQFQQEISQSFRQCALKSHPDKSDDDTASEKMAACNNAKEYLNTHFQCLDQDPNYGAFLHAFRQSQLGKLSPQYLDFIIRFGNTARPEAIQVMDKWREETLSEQRSQNTLAALSKEEREEKERLEREREQKKREHKSRVRGGSRAA